MDASENVRKNYFVKRGFQIKFILKFCVIVLAGTLISTGLLFLFSKGTLTSSFQNSRLVVVDTAVAILPAILYTGLITILLVTIATVMVTLFISHKIAGPLFRFEKELTAIGQGDLTKTVALRRKDQATALAESINQMSAGLRERVTRIQTLVEGLLQSAREKNAPQDIILELENLRSEITKNLKT